MKKNTHQTARTHDSRVLDEFLSLGTPEELARTESRMMLAAKIADAMAEKKIGKKQFAELVGQSPSVITKWLSGGHNFTVDTLTDIQRVLNVRLLALEEKPVAQIIYQVNVNVTESTPYKIPIFKGGSSFGVSPKDMVNVPISSFDRQIPRA
jgi:transcriptional regulator with XRE-family HTH domain